MNAEDLAFEPDTFDVILSLSTFEHFFNGPKSCERCTSPKAKRQSPNQFSTRVDFFLRPPFAPHTCRGRANSALGTFALTEETMQRACTGRWPADVSMSLREAIEWITRVMRSIESIL